MMAMKHMIMMMIKMMVMLMMTMMMMNKLSVLEANINDVNDMGYFIIVKWSHQDISMYCQIKIVALVQVHYECVTR